MTYPELLLQKEWFEKCNVIIQRDKHRCKRCGCLGYHNGTIYSTDSLEEVETIINEKILLGDKFSSLIDQTFKGFIESDYVYKKALDEINSDTHTSKITEKIISSEESEYELHGNVIWEPYKNIEIFNQYTLEGLFVNEIKLFKRDGHHFRNEYEVVNAPRIVTSESHQSFDFKLHRYRKSLKHSDGSNVSYPMAILRFDYKLSDKFYISIEKESISLTYKNYVFFVCHYDLHNIIYRGLNVHHEYYIHGHKPWEYENDALVTLCEECHRKRHEDIFSPIPKYRSFPGKVIEKYCGKCDRCEGSGYLHQYDHVQHGICFKCGGEGVVVD